MSVALPNYIPLFPLPNVVFFPRTFLPLHIFEPRYRAMTRHAWDEDQLVGMVLLQEGWEKDYYGKPPVYSVGCVGKIVTLQPLDDGRFNLILQGLRRFEIQDEHGGQVFRQAFVHWIDEEGDYDPSLRQEIVQRVEALGRHQGNLQETIEAILELNLDDNSLIQTLSSTLPFTPLEKQFLLEAANLDQQSRRLMDLLSFEIHSYRKGKG